MLLSGESKTVEFKKEYSKTILKTICAYANFHDGVIVIGVNDQGTVIGIPHIDELKLNVENAINDTIVPRPYYEFEIQEIDGSQLLVLKVFKGDYTPYTYQGKAYVRRDTSTVQADAALTQQLILEGRNLSFEDLISTSQTLTFETLEKKMKSAFQITALTEDLLKTLGLKGERGFNNAAALLSDENPIRDSIVHLVAFSDQGVGRIKDRLTLQACSVLNQFDRCMDFYEKHINTGEIIETAYRKTVEDVPFIAYREAIANLLVHRDYTIEAAARVEFYTDRIEIVSPGGLPAGILVEEYLEGRLSKARNRVLSDLFLRLKIIEKLATGVRRIKEQYSSYNVKPKFLVSEHAVVVILPHIVTSGFREQSEPQKMMRKSLVGNEKIAYEWIQMNPGIKRVSIQQHIGLEKSQSIEVLNSLREKGYIVKIGNGPATGYKAMD